MSTPAIDEAFGFDSHPATVPSSGQLILTIFMSVMKCAAGTVPKEVWGLSRALDLVAPRGCIVGGDESFECYCQRSTQAGRCPIIRLRTGYIFNKPIIIHPGIRSVEFQDFYDMPLIIPAEVERLKLGRAFNHPIDLPSGLKELEFSSGDGAYCECLFNHPLVLPSSLRRITLGNAFNQPIVLPPLLEYVRLGSYLFSHELTLPQTLKVLDMRMVQHFNYPLHLPPHLEELYLNRSYNHAIILPNSLHTAYFGSGFMETVTFGTGLRTLSWYCDHPLSLLPNTLRTLTLGYDFEQRLDLPEGLERITFLGEYSLPLVLPSGCVRQDPAPSRGGYAMNANSDNSNETE